MSGGELAEVRARMTPPKEPGVCRSSRKSPWFVHRQRST